MHYVLTQEDYLIDLFKPVALSSNLEDVQTKMEERATKIVHEVENDFSQLAVEYDDAKLTCRIRGRSFFFLWETLVEFRIDCVPDVGTEK